MTSEPDTPDLDPEFRHPDLDALRELIEQDTGATVEWYELTAKEGRALIDERARRFLGMSGDEFARRYEAGELDEDDDAVLRVALLLPLGREERS